MKLYKDLKVGDIITAYHKGYWRILSFEDRSDEGEESPVVSMEKVADAKFKLTGKKKQIVECDAAYCSKVNRRKLMEEHLKTLNDIMLFAKEVRL